MCIKNIFWACKTFPIRGYLEESEKKYYIRKILTMHRFRGDIQETQAVSFVLSPYIHLQQQKLFSREHKKLKNVGIILQTFTTGLTQMVSLLRSYVL